MINHFLALTAFPAAALVSAAAVSCLTTFSTAVV
jgi:hypothetical protein